MNSENPEKWKIDTIYKKKKNLKILYGNNIIKIVVENKKYPKRH